MKNKTSQTVKALEFLDNIWQNKTCDICGSTNWEIQDVKMSPNTFISHKVYNFGCPQYIIACLDCANIKSFSINVIKSIMAKQSKISD